MIMAPSPFILNIGGRRPASEMTDLPRSRQKAGSMASCAAAGRSRMRLRCTVNGERVAADIPPRLLLVDFIRHELKLTGTHVGCESGICGSCTIIVDGAPVRSCLMFAVQADGCEVRTIESLAAD